MSKNTRKPKEKKYDGVLDFTWMTTAPLSHIGESDGTESSLVRMMIEGPDREAAEVFTFQGNALRGMLRDCAAKYFQDNISPDGILQIPLDSFYMLWSGGAISDDTKVDPNRTRKLRRLIPALSVFGAAIGNGTMPGKIDVGNLYPLYREVLHIVPEDVAGQCLSRSYETATGDVQYTRTDDAKNPDKAAYILDASGAEEALALDGEEGGKNGDEKKKKKAPQQMRYGYEVINPGTWLWSEIDIRGLTEVEMGAFVSAFYEWAKHPKIGGKSGVGMGKVRMEATLHLFEKDFEPETEPETFFATQGRGLPVLGEVAEGCKAKYDELLSSYLKHIQSEEPDIKAVLGA